MSDMTIIGRAEKIEFIDAGIAGVPAKIDTGADSSSVWATDVHEEPKGLYCKLFGTGSEHYTGQEMFFAPTNYRITRVANSFGQKEIRYKVKLRIKVKGRII